MLSEKKKVVKMEEWLVKKKVDKKVDKLELRMDIW
jgi:hypothetical protein